MGVEVDRERRRSWTGAQTPVWSPDSGREDRVSLMRLQQSPPGAPLPSSDALLGTCVLYLCSYLPSMESGSWKNTCKLGGGGGTTYLRQKAEHFAATWMDLEMIILSEVSQAEKDKYHMMWLICRILKKRYRWTYLQSRNRLTNIENKLLVTKGKGGRGDKLGVWD